MSSTTQTQRADPPWLGLVQSQIESLRFGVVQVVVHDSRVIQIERTEKFRFDKGSPVVPPTTVSTNGTPATPEVHRPISIGSKLQS